MRTFAIFMICLAATSTIHALVNGGNAPSTSSTANCLETGSRPFYASVCTKCAPGFRLVDANIWNFKMILCTECPKSCAKCVDLQVECPVCAEGYFHKVISGQKICFKTEEQGTKWTISRNN